MLACLPPLPLVLLSASLNCFNLAQSAVGYDQWHRLSSILFVLASLKIQKDTCRAEKKYFAKIFEYFLKNGRACRGDHFTTIHILSLFRFVAVLSFLAAEIFSTIFLDFRFSSWRLDLLSDRTLLCRFWDDYCGSNGSNDKKNGNN